MLAQIADALAYAHARKVVHRDLSPNNVMVEMRDGAAHAIVIDFGLAKTTAVDPVTAKLTHTGDLLGSPLYMSPEQASGLLATPTSDQYALGCIAYELLTGVAAAAGTSLGEVLERQRQHPPRRFAEVDPTLDVPPAFEAIVLRALCKLPENRFASAAELRDALLELEQSPPVPVPDESAAMSAIAVREQSHVAMRRRPRIAMHWVWLAVLVAAGTVIWTVST